MARFKTVGTLRYGPTLLGQQPSMNWWAILDCHAEIGRYYRHLHFITTNRKLQRPAWSTHVTVVANEEPAEGRKPLWQKYEGAQIVVEVVPPVSDNGKFFWLGVESFELSAIRVELGLPRQPKYPFHLTIGNAPESDAS